jgi:nucleoid-associated protein EbfC
MNNPNMADLVGKMMEMQQRMADAQAKLAEKTTTAEAGGGMVRVTVDGTGRVTAVKLEPAVVNPDEMELLEDLIIAGVNKAVEESARLREDEMKKTASSMLPPGFDLGGLGI